MSAKRTSRDRRRRLPRDEELAAIEAYIAANGVTRCDWREETNKAWKDVSYRAFSVSADEPAVED